MADGRLAIAALPDYRVDRGTAVSRAAGAVALLLIAALAAMPFWGDSASLPSA